MNTTQMKVEQIVSNRQRRHKEIRDGKITMIVILIALIAVMATSCTTQRSGCYMSRGFSGTH